MIKRSGYNVIELLVVITAISLIMAIGYKGVNVLMNNIKAEQLSSQLRQIQVGMGKYYADTGTYPTKLSLLLEKDDGADADAYDAISIAFYGDPDSGDTVAIDYWAGPYLEGMEKQGDCIKSVVGYEICLGADYTTNGEITQLYTTDWDGSKTNGGKSVKQDSNSIRFYHVLSVRGIEAEMAINLFKNLNKRAIDSVPSNADTDDAVVYNRENILNNSDIIGVGTRASLQATKTIVYRYTQAY